MARNDAMVDAPAEVVFSLLRDPRSYEHWVVGNKRVRRFDPAWPEPRSEFHHTVGFGPLAVRDKTCVAEVDPPTCLVLHARAMPAGVAEVRLDLTPQGAGTRVTITEQPISGPAARFSNPVLDLLVGARNAESLRRLRRLAEERQASPGASARS
ncbi:MAG: SRPBCC family protein [Actinomycetota bacterium]